MATPKKSATKKPSKKPTLEAAVDPALLEALKKALTKDDLRLLFAPLALARTLPDPVRAITFLAAVAKKSKDTLPVLLVRAVGSALARAGTAKQLAKLANKALDAMRGVSQWDYLSVAPEVLFLAEIAGTDRFDRALHFYESADLALDGLIEKLVVRAAARGEDTLALRQLAAHAPSVRPIVATLRDAAASAAEREAAVARANALDEDARVVFDQLLCGTADRENDLVWPSLSRLLQAPVEQHIHRSSLRNALATLRFVEGIEPLLQSAAAQPRARDRLAALIDNDSSEYSLELVLSALRPYAGQYEVFDQVKRAFDTPGRAAGELCSEWFRDRRSGAWEFINDAQAALVIDAMIFADQAGVSEAHHALYYVSHPGCEARIIRELDRICAEKEATKSDSDLYWSLVFALGHIGTDSAVTFVRKLAFEATDDGVWECCSVLASTLSDERFEAHLAAARAQKNPHSALSVLATVCTDFIEKGALAAERDRLIIELARVSAMTEGSSSYRAHVLLEGVAAALRTLSPDVVSELSGALGIEKAPSKSKALPKVTSRFCELRKSEYTSPFESDTGAKLLRRWAEALDGTLLSRMTATRHGPIEGPLTDDVIEAVAGSPVSERWVSTSDEVWFVGEDSKLHVVGRGGVGAAGVVLTSVLDVPGPHLPRGRAMDERASLWTKSASHFIEAQRYGAALFVAHGPNNGSPRRWVLRFDDERAAAAAVQLLRDSPPRDFAAIPDPWNVEGYGGVSREYFVANSEEPDAAFETVALHVLGDDVDDEASRAREIAAEEARILHTGGTLKTIEPAARLRRNRDRSVHEWLTDRARDDDRDARWHLEALTDAQRAIAATGVAIDLEVRWSAPASQDEIAALQSLCAVPPALIECWKSVASAGFRLGNLTGTLLSPAQVIAQRDAWLEAVSGMKKPDARLAKSWPLVMIEQGDVTAFEAVFDGAASGGEPGQFTSMDNANWWEESLAWILATGLLSIFARAVLAAEPALGVACFGARAHTIERVSLAHPSKKWWRLVQVDRAIGVSHGKEGGRGAFDRTLYESTELATRAKESAVAAKRKQGYKG